MNKILFSSLVTLAAVSAVVGGTYAYFSDSETVAGNTFSTATLVINNSSESWMLPATFSGLKPGDMVRKWVVIKNEGSIDVGTLTVTAKNKKDGEPSLLDKLVVSAVGKTGTSEAAIFTPNWAATKPTVTSWMNGADMLDVAFYRTPAGVIKPGESYTMSFDFTVPADLGNDYQGKTASFDMEFYAEQVH